MIDDLIHELARRQYGCFNRIQVLELGGDDPLIKRRLAARRWGHEANGVYSLAGHPDSWMRKLWIAHLEVGLHSVVALESAARLERFELYRHTSTIVLAVAHGDHERRREYEVRQCTDLLPEHVTRLHGLPVTAAARTLVDLARFTRYKRFERTFDDAVNNRGVVVDDVQRLHDQLRRRGKRGMRLVEAMLADFGDGEPPPDSELNRMFRKAVLLADVRPPSYEASWPWRPKGERRWDAVWDEELVIFEVDGRKYHQRKLAMDEDRKRDREASLHGYMTYRFMWPELVHELPMVVSTIEEAVRQGAERREWRRRASGLWTP